MNIEVGDKVTYKDLERNEIYTRIITYTGMKKYLMNTKYYEIIKIERPKYDMKFKNLESNKIYNLKELGLEE